MDEQASGRKTQPRGEARRRAMIEAAWQVLQEKGCEGATLNDIIALSGGSRATLYGAFGGKEGLVEAAVAERCGAFTESMQLVLDEHNSPRVVLEALARAYLVKVFDAEALRTLSIFIAEGGRFPHVVEAFLNHGPNELRRRIACYLARATEAGTLAVDNPEETADLFLSMLQGQWVLRLLTQSVERPPPEWFCERARRAVAIFLDGVGAKAPAERPA